MCQIILFFLHSHLFLHPPYVVGSPWSADGNASGSTAPICGEPGANEEDARPEGYELRQRRDKTGPISNTLHVLNTLLSVLTFILEQIRRAQRTGILNLKGSGLRSVPPEVATLEELRIADLRDNGCEQD